MCFVLVLIGVSGCGKTTIASAVSRKLKCQFIDADDYHTEASVKKMKKGEALTDEGNMSQQRIDQQSLICFRNYVQDRKLWLARLENIVKAHVNSHHNLVLACSALKRSYRNQLMYKSAVWFVYLKGEKELIQKRLNLRIDHFMPVTLLESQFQTLEEPCPDDEEKVIVVDIDKNIDDVVNFVITFFLERTNQ